MDFNYSKNNSFNFANIGSNFENEADSECAVDGQIISPSTSACHVTHTNRNESIEEKSDDELIIVDDEGDSTKMSSDCHQNEVVNHQPEPQPERQPEPINVGADELRRGLEDIRIDITGHRASRVIVSNMGATTHFCDLCGTETGNLDDHHGYCPAELNLGPDLDRVFDAGEFLEHLMADEPRAEPPPVATRYIPGDHVNNIEFLLNCFAKERTRQQ